MYLHGDTLVEISDHGECVDDLTGRIRTPMTTLRALRDARHALLERGAYPPDDVLPRLEAALDALAALDAAVVSAAVDFEAQATRVLPAFDARLTTRLHEILGGLGPDTPRR